MLALIPVDEKDVEEASLTKLDEVQAWALIDIENGKLKSCEFYDSREQINDWIDCVIVQNSKEYVWPFIEENIAVLIAPHQRSIEDIVEAFLFKELHDMNV